MPAYDLFPMDKYVGFSQIEHYNEAVTSRGCEGACNFCYEWGLIDPRRSGDFIVHRTRSGKLVADEMELLNQTYGVKALNFLDDDFNSDRQKMLDLLAELEKRRRRYPMVFYGPGAQSHPRRRLDPENEKSRMLSGALWHRGGNR